jgi:U6 snRNA-associated Sm-like protein LSm7
MSERGSFRGGGRNRGGGYDRSGGRGGGRGGGASGGAQQQQQEKPKKENILDLSKYMDKEVRVKFNGGREGDILPHPESSTYANILQFPAL